MIVVKNILIHTEYMNRVTEARSLTSEQKKQLAGRKDTLHKKFAEYPRNEQLTEEENKWLARSYPVLAVLAPVMSTSEDKIEFPGDPMCLYNALSYAVDQTVQAREQGITTDSAYNEIGRAHV